METLTLPDGYSRLKVAPTSAYRRMTVAEAKALTYGQRVPFLANDGTAREAKVNGAPKTWKTRPDEVAVPLKYGMYECGTVRERGDGTVDRLLVRA